MLSSHTVAQASFKYFFTAILGTPLTNLSKEYSWAPHHDEWLKLVEDHQQVQIQCARGHGKTWFFLSYVLWLAYRHLSWEILIISQTEEQVRTNIMDKLDMVINTNPYLEHLRPSTSQRWGAQLKTFPFGMTIRAESFGSSVRGAHPRLMWIDDPLKEKGGMSPDEQGDYFRSALMGTAMKDTQIIITGTPLDANDLLEQLENNKAFITKKYPAENEDRTAALFPYKFKLEDLRKIENTVGSLAYARERLLQRIDPKTQIFKDQYRTINTEVQFPEFASVRTIIDPAISEKDNACDSAIVTVGIDAKNHLWEIDTRLVHADDPTQILKEVTKVANLLHTKYYDYAIVIENEVFQKVLAYDLRQYLIEKNLSLRVIEVAHSGIQGKHQRIVGLQPKWEARAIHLLPESPLISQFRYYRPNIKGSKIDAVDAFSWIRHEEVAIPVYDVQAIDPGVPDEVWE